MSALSLENVKVICVRTKDCVNGYIKNCQKLLPEDNVYYTIPTLVIHWILLYFHIGDQFDPANCAKGYELCYENNTIVALNYNTEGNKGAVYLKNIARKGIHKWTFKLLKVNSDDWFDSIGVWKVKYPIKITDRVEAFSNRQGFGWIVNWKWSVYTNKSCVTCDIVEMILDLNKLELRYKVNGNELDAAFTDIEQTDYKAVISMNWTGDSIQFVSYQCL